MQFANSCKCRTTVCFAGKNGHTICGVCTDRLKETSDQCPECRVPLNQGDAMGRVLALEKLLSDRMFECLHDECRERLIYSKLTVHVDACAHKPKPTTPVACVAEPRHRRGQSFRRRHNYDYNYAAAEHAAGGDRTPRYLFVLFFLFFLYAAHINQQFKYVSFKNMSSREL
jgi:hypothetical protein